MMLSVSLVKSVAQTGTGIVHYNIASLSGSISSVSVLHVIICVEKIGESGDMRQREVHKYTVIFLMHVLGLVLHSLEGELS